MSYCDDENLMLALGYRIKNDISNAQKLLLLSYECGNKRAVTHMLFAYYFRGWGFQADDEKMLHTIEKALCSKHAVGMFFHALLLKKKGKTDESNRWVELIDGVSDPLAKGLCCYYEIGINNPYSKAKLYLKMAAKEGDEYGQYMLGFYFESEKKIEKSIKWFGKAAAQGNSCALGALYYYHIQESKRLSGLMILHNYK